MKINRSKRWVKKTSDFRLLCRAAQKGPSVRSGFGSYNHLLRSLRSHPVIIANLSMVDWRLKVHISQEFEIKNERGSYSEHDRTVMYQLRSYRDNSMWLWGGKTSLPRRKKQNSKSKSMTSWAIQFLGLVLFWHPVAIMLIYFMNHLCPYSKFFCWLMLVWVDSYNL